ncbi:hypothetical protein R3X27_07410 [Tropicimonas sp. TH_r6]|uniref:hypothetical protein n=1 Tax=Tropicimonas sp. TH_r6 TaxID=3082085 RepID=UPI002952DF33|nr:hypothetical protein [Tropicimonas sp. TH_r6]MDV7142508.1 hypothetical protein [Tropicimonas sp. TH_r6]
MKITRQTHSQLVLDYRPWPLTIGLALFILFFAGAGITMLMRGDPFGLVYIFGGGGIGLLCMLVFVERLQLILNRQSGNVRMRRRTLRGYHEDVQPLRSLLGARVELSQSRGREPSSRLVLVFDSPTGPMARPLAGVSVTGSGVGPAAQAVNDWLGIAPEDVPAPRR